METPDISLFDKCNAKMRPFSVGNEKLPLEQRSLIQQDQPFFYQPSNSYYMILIGKKVLSLIKNFAREEIIFILIHVFCWVVFTWTEKDLVTYSKFFLTGERAVEDEQDGHVKGKIAIKEHSYIFLEFRRMKTNQIFWITI